jgi:hypothetical protein
MQMVISSVWVVMGSQCMGHLHWKFCHFEIDQTTQKTLFSKYIFKHFADLSGHSGMMFIPVFMKIHPLIQTLQYHGNYFISLIFLIK